MSLSPAVKSDYGYNNKDNVTLPTMVPSPLGMTLVGRLKGNACASGMYGRFLINSPFCFLASGNTTIRKGSGNSLTPTQLILIKSMTEFSEGTDFLVTGDGAENV
jgi:hypothetical protein